MRKLIFVAAALAAAMVLAMSAASPAPSKLVIGVVDFVEGSVTLTRSGKVVKGIKIDAPIYNLDKIQTAKGASLEIVFDKSTGIAGSMKIKSGTVLSLSLETLKAGPKTTADMLSGSVAVKEKLSSGSTFDVKTSAAAMGVRGTNFEVTSSINGNILVDCEEGEVSCAPVDPLTGSADAGKAVSALPGSVVESREGESFKKVPVAVSGLKKFREEWITGEEALFRGNPVKTIRILEDRYRTKVGEFKEAFTALYGSAAFKAWKAEDAGGKAGDKMTLLKQKKELAPLLLRIRKVAFIFERVYYRIADVAGYVTPAMMKLEIRRGYDLAAFLRDFEKDRAKLEEAMAIFRYAETLYADRGAGDEGGIFGADSPLSGSGLLGGGSGSGR